MAVHQDPFADYLSSIDKVIAGQDPTAKDVPGKEEPSTTAAVQEDIFGDEFFAPTVAEAKRNASRAKGADKAKDKAHSKLAKKKEKKSTSRYVYTGEQLSQSSQKLPDPILKTTTKRRRHVEEIKREEDLDPSIKELFELEEMYNTNSRHLFGEQPLPKMPHLFGDNTQLDFGESVQDMTIEEAQQIQSVFDDIGKGRRNEPEAAEDPFSDIFDLIEPLDADFEYDEVTQAGNGEGDVLGDIGDLDDLDNLSGVDGEDGVVGEKGTGDDIQVAIYPAAQFHNSQYASVADLPPIVQKSGKPSHMGSYSDPVSNYDLDDVLAAASAVDAIRNVPYQATEEIRAIQQKEQREKLEEKKTAASKKRQPVVVHPKTEPSPIFGDDDDLSEIDMPIPQHMPVLMNRFSSDAKKTIGRAMAISLDSTATGYDIAQMLKNTLFDLIVARVEGTDDGYEFILHFDREEEILESHIDINHDIGLLTQAAENRGEPVRQRITRLNPNSKKTIKEEMPVMPYERLGDLLTVDVHISFARLVVEYENVRYMILISDISPDIAVSWPRNDEIDPIDELPSFIVALSSELAAYARRDMSRAGQVVARDAAPATERMYKCEVFETDEDGNVSFMFPKQARERARLGQ